MRSLRPPLTPVLLAALVLLAGTGAPSVTKAGGGPWLSLSLLGGATRPDSDLSNYRWDVGGKFTWGGEAILGNGSWGTGVRIWNWSTTQSTGILGAQTSPTVSLRSVQLVGQFRPFSLMGFRTFAFGSFGRVRLGYSPDRITLNVEGVSEPVVVNFEPVNEWILGLGAGVERSLAHGIALGMEVERSTFSLDTVHRSGDAIVEDRESFKNWNLRFRLSLELRS
jgi:hypothetical protein